MSGLGRLPAAARDVPEEQRLRVSGAVLALREDPDRDDWSDPGPAAMAGEPDLAALAQRIREARTDDERMVLQQEVAALVLTGVLTPAAAREVRGPLAAAREDAAKARSVPKDDPEAYALFSPDGYLLVQAFERIVDDERRAKVLVFAREQLEEDVRLLPAVDPVGAL